MSLGTGFGPFGIWSEPIDPYVVKQVENLRYTLAYVNGGVTLVMNEETH